MLAVVGACASSPPISVRLADAPRVEVAPRTIRPLQMSCALSGAPAPELFDPVVAFARAHLVDRLDSFDRDASTPVHVRRTSPHLPTPPDQRGVLIDVDPRTALGQLTVTNRWAGGRAVNRYCLHVVRERGGNAVLIEPLFASISAR